MKFGFLKTLKPFVVKHQPEILIGMGIAGMIFSTVSAVKATVNAQKAMQNYKADGYINGDYKFIDGKRKDQTLTKTDVIKLTWKYYIPTAISMAISVPCIIAGNRISNTRNMALAAAYTISETALQEYQDKTRELIGPKKEQEIHEAVSKDIVDKSYGKSQILLTGDGESLFHEPISGRYFKSNWNKILKAANELNADAITDPFGQITLTQWYNIIGLEGTSMSDDMGWTIMNGVSGLIDIQVDSVLTPDNTPCGSIHYNNRPKML